MQTTAALSGRFGQKGCRHAEFSAVPLINSRISSVVGCPQGWTMGQCDLELTHRRFASHDMLWQAHGLGDASASSKKAAN